MKQNVLKVLRPMLLVLVLMQGGLSVQAQSLIKGRITSAEDGLGLPGVSILEKGTTNGTVTDLDGNYSISVSQGTTLVFSYIGYLTQEIVVGSQAELSVVMEPDTQTLEEIVVIGYGTQKKAELSSAVTSVDVDNIKKLPGGNVANLLQGQAAGVTAVAGSGAPGSFPVVRVRGLGTINNNNPLFVIDGIPGNISSINPADIESINVLKDAAAATIYGSRASNGVIVVTTKRGQKGKLNVSLNAYVGTKQIAKKLDMLDSQGNNQVSTAARAADGIDAWPYTTEPIQNNTNWQDELFQNGVEQKYDLGIGGGNEFANYYMSVGLFDEKGTIVNTGYKRFNLRFNSDFKVSDRITVGQTISYAKSNRRNFGEDESSDNGGWADLSPILTLLEAMPHNAVHDPTSPNGFAAPVAGFGNPVGIHSIVTDEFSQDRIQANFYIEAKIIEGLKFRSQYGLNVYSNYSEYFAPTYNFGAQSANPMADLSETRAQTEDWIWNNVLDFNKSFGDHNVSALVGIVAEEHAYRSTGGGNDDIPYNDLRALDAGAGSASSWGDNNAYRIFSVFGQFNYAMSDKYLIQASIRRDGSTKFGPQNRYGVFPSVSVGWRVSSEDFFNVSFISNLKPRFSYGKTGNDRIPNYQYQRLISSNANAINYPLGDSESQDVSVGTISRAFADEGIKWEESIVSNFGLDLGLMEDQIVVTFDYFDTETSDMLWVPDFPATSGITSGTFSNIASMKNRGWELAMTYKKVAGDFTFDVTGNFTSTKNEVLQLGRDGEVISAGHILYNQIPTTRTEVGRSIGEFFLVQSDGLFQSQSEIDAHGAQPGAQPGDIRFIDQNEDGLINDDDRVYTGASGLPDFEYGLIFNGSYRQFDFSMFFQGSHGNEIYNGTKVYNWRRQGDRKNWSADLLDAWTPSNTNTSVPRLTANDDNGNFDTPSDYFVEDGSYLRLSNVQVGYTFNSIDNFFSSARVYLAGQNLFTITGYSGYDPTNGGFQQFSRGVDVGWFPTSRNIMMGVQFQF